MKKSPWTHLVCDNVSRADAAAYELDKTHTHNINKLTIPHKTVEEYIMYHITFNWPFVHEFLKQGFSELPIDSSKKKNKKKKKKNNRKKNRIRCIRVATSAIYDPMYRRSRSNIKHWTFLLICLEIDPSCLYFFWSDKDNGIWFNHRLHMDPIDPKNVQSYESPRRNTLKFNNDNRILGTQSNIPDGYELDFRHIVGGFEGRPIKYQFRRWEDGGFYGHSYLSEFTHRPMHNVSIFNNDLKRNMKTHIEKHWTLLFMAYFKKMEYYKVLSNSDYFTMHFLIPILADDLVVCPFIDSNVKFISIVWYSVLNVNMDKTIFWHMSTSDNTVYSEVKCILGDYTCTPFNCLYGIEHVDKTKDIYQVCGYPDIEPDDILWEYRDIYGRINGHGSITAFKTEHIDKVRRGRAIDLKMAAIC